MTALEDLAGHDEQLAAKIRKQIDVAEHKVTDL
jgi:hypothetical protein